MTTRFLNQAVNNGEIELPFCRFDELPVDRNQHRIEIEGDKLGPNRLHVFDTRRSGITYLAAEDQKRFTVHNELGGSSLAAQMNAGVLLRLEGHHGRYEQYDGERDRSHASL